MKRLDLVLFLGITVAICSCNEIATDNSHRNLSLEVVEVDVTEAWIRFSSISTPYGSNVVIKRNGETVLTLGQSTLDTVWRDEGLVPHKSYTYRAFKQADATVEDASNVLSLTTLDSTSHLFRWEIDTLGDGANSHLNDVVVIHDTLVYAVGEIHKRDSTGQFEPEAYNVARWNGAGWKLLKIATPVYNYDCSIAGYSATNLNAIFAFSSGQVLLNATTLLKGDSIRFLPCIPPDIVLRGGEITKTWGTSEDDFYAVGRNGLILHFDHGNWLWMDSGTDVDLLDVWGSPDDNTVWTCGYYHSRQGTLLLRHARASSTWEIAYDGGAAETNIREDSLSGAFASVFVPTGRRLYIASNAGMYKATPTTHGEAERLSFTPTFFPGFPNRLRGNGVNDVTIVGYYTMLAHYNGMTWFYFDQFVNANEHFYSVSQHEALTVAVGEIYDPINSKGLVFRGRR